MSALGQQALCEKATLYTSQSGYQHPDFDDFVDALKGWDRDGDPSLIATLWQSRQVNPFLITRALSNNLVGIISQIWKLKNDGVAFIRDQVGSAAALDEAFFQLQAGYADVAIVVISGCAEDCYSAVAEQKPFPANAEHSGAAVLILESESHATERGASVQAWLEDYSSHKPPTSCPLDGPHFREQKGLEWAGIVMSVAQTIKHLADDRFEGRWAVESGSGKTRKALAVLKRNFT
ncbi:hypothetical protein R2X38_25480 [Photobacterium rosenbergii]|uniref:Uncharacterized protein n=2 Tax=Photobacterium rosenbergii TaxID=294936 RepID=A0ABU3ZQR6_9GAMM|nr:hypothetical protein [Photobacterium rosenbergii]